MRAHVEVVVTLKEPPLAQAFAHERTLAYSSFARPHRLLLSAPASRTYLDRLAQTQRVVRDRIRTAIPSARDSLALRRRPQRLLRRRAAEPASTGLARIPGVDHVWPTVTLPPTARPHAAADRRADGLGADARAPQARE